MYPEEDILYIQQALSRGIYQARQRDIQQPSQGTVDRVQLIALKFLDKMGPTRKAT
jgi:hypothetical protein